jgi:hypothetical protein
MSHEREDETLSQKKYSNEEKKTSDHGPNGNPKPFPRPEATDPHPHDPNENPKPFPHPEATDPHPHDPNENPKPFPHPEK